MLLSTFINDLWQQGSVTVASELVAFSAEDESVAKQYLLRYYANDTMHASGKVPAFHGNAALWPARFLYRAVQLTLLRDKGAETVKEQLIPYNGSTHALVNEAIQESLGNYRNEPWPAFEP